MVALVARPGVIESEVERPAPPALVLGPSWRPRADDLAPLPGWQQNASTDGGQWTRIDRGFTGYAAQLRRSTVAGYPATLAMRSPEGPSALGVIADIADQGSMVAIATGVVVAEVRPDGGELGALDAGLTLAGLLGWPDDHLTVTDRGSTGAGSFGPGGKRPRSMAVVQLERPDAAARLGALMTGPDGVVDCWSSRGIPDPDTSPLLIGACTVRGEPTRRGRYENTEMVGTVLADRMGVRAADVDLWVDIERADGSVKTWRVGAYRGDVREGVIDEGGERVTGYVFRAVGTDGRPLTSWRWPGAE